MNAVFFILTLASIIMLCFTRPDDITGIMLEGGRNAIELTLKLLAIYALWMSVLRMLEATGANRKLDRLLSPFTKKIFKHESEEARGFINLNLASNLLGLGGAATPAGIKAMNAMCDCSGRASKSMVMLIVLNATSLQLLPTTVISLLCAHGSAQPSAIILPTLLSTVISTVCGALLVAVFVKN